MRDKCAIFNLQIRPDVTAQGCLARCIFLSTSFEMFIPSFLEVDTSTCVMLSVSCVCPSDVTSVDNIGNVALTRQWTPTLVPTLAVAVWPCPPQDFEHGCVTFVVVFGNMLPHVGHRSI